MATLWSILRVCFIPAERGGGVTLQSLQVPAKFLHVAGQEQSYIQTRPVGVGGDAAQLWALGSPTAVSTNSIRDGGLSAVDLEGPASP